MNCGDSGPSLVNESIGLNWVGKTRGIIVYVAKGK